MQGRFYRMFGQLPTTEHYLEIKLKASMTMMFADLCVRAQTQHVQLVRTESGMIVCSCFCFISSLSETDTDNISLIVCFRSEPRV